MPGHHGSLLEAAWNGVEVPLARRRAGGLAALTDDRLRPDYSSLALRYSLFSLAMCETEISFGHSASQA